MGRSGKERAEAPDQPDAVKCTPSVPPQGWSLLQPIRLVIAVRAILQNTSDEALLHRCLCSVYKHHPQGWVHVFDRRLPDAPRIRQSDYENVRTCRLNQNASLMHAVAAVLDHAVQVKATHLAFLEHQTSIRDENRQKDAS